MRKLMIDTHSLSRTHILTHYSLLLSMFQAAMHGTMNHKEFIDSLTEAYGCGKLSDMQKLGSNLNDHFNWTHPEDPDLPPLFSVSIKQLDLTIFVYKHDLVALVESSTGKTILLTRMD